MNKPQKILLAGAAGSFAVSLLHVILAICASNVHLMILFGAPQEYLDLIEQRSVWMYLGPLALAAIFALWGLYALAGIGKFRPLPFLKPILYAIGIIYTLRGLLIVENILYLFSASADIAVGFFGLVSSVVALGIGLCHLAGVWKTGN